VNHKDELVTMQKQEIARLRRENKSLEDRLNSSRTSSKAVSNKIVSLPVIKQEDRVFKGMCPLKVFTDSFNGFMAYCDTQLRFKFANKKYEDVFGLTQEQIIGHTIKEVIGAHNYREEPMQEVLKSGKETRFNKFIIVSKQRQVRIGLNVHLTPDRDEQGEIIGFFIVCQIRHNGVAHTEVTGRKYGVSHQLKVDRLR
jgi:PAS domain S-box-containing protein